MKRHPSIERAAVISTGHLDPDSADMLRDSMGYPQKFGGWSYEYGWGFPVQGILRGGAEFAREIPICLAMAAAWALAQDCTYLFFDQDGGQIDGLPTWEWEGK